MATVPQLIRRYAKQYNVGPWAAMAVAMAEGGLRWGAVGDQGTSFGPFQLHRGGALPAGKGAAWANSPAGIEYAIRRMAESGAAGLRGRAAINSIVRNFERPADPDAEIKRAMGYWQDLRGGPLPLGGGPQAAQFWAYDPKDISSAQGKTAALSLLGVNPVLAAAVGKRISQQVQPQLYNMNIPGMGVGGQSGSDLMLALLAMARKMGMTSLENPYVDAVAPVHTKGSYHYQNFPGKYNGRTLGRGVDISGGNMQQFLQAVLRRWGRSPFTEIFYDPWGQWDAGRFSRQGIGGHSDHIHFSI